MSSQSFRISPLIRITLNSLYLALVLPLPVSLYRQSGIPVTMLLCIGLGIGWLSLQAALSQQVRVDEESIAVCYPPWVPSFFQQGWSVDWQEVTEIYTTSTSQGGLAYYLVARSGQRYLIPMRILGFRKLLRLIQSYTGLDTSTLNPFVQPWMYLILAVCSLLLLAWDLGILWVGLTAPI